MLFTNKKQCNFFRKYTDNDILILYLRIGLSGSRHCGKDLCSRLVYLGTSETGKLRLEREGSNKVYLWVTMGNWGLILLGNLDGGYYRPCLRITSKFNLSTYVFIGERLPLFRGITRASQLSQSSPCGQNTQSSDREAGALVRGFSKTREWN